MSGLGLAGQSLWLVAAPVEGLGLLPPISPSFSNTAQHPREPAYLEVLEEGGADQQTPQVRCGQHGDTSSPSFPMPPRPFTSRAGTGGVLDTATCQVGNMSWSLME